MTTPIAELLSEDYEPDTVEVFCANALARELEMDGDIPCVCNKCIRRVWRPLILWRNRAVEAVSPNEALPLADPEKRAEFNRTLDEVKAQGEKIVSALVDALSGALVDEGSDEHEDTIRAPRNPFEC